MCKWSLWPPPGLSLGHKYSPAAQIRLWGRWSVKWIACPASVAERKVSVRRVPVESSSIASVGYDATARTLEVEFRHGAIYRYLNVDPEAHQAFLAWRITWLHAQRNPVGRQHAGRVGGSPGRHRRTRPAFKPSRRIERSQCLQAETRRDRKPHS